MRYTLICAALAALQATSVIAAVIERGLSDVIGDISERDLEERAPKKNVPVRKCGSTDPPAEVIAAADNFRQQNVGPQALIAAHDPIVVNTYFHVVTSTSKQGRYTQTQLNNQLTYMNNAYGPNGITFNLISSDFTVNNQWATGNYDSKMKPALRKGNYADLNVYFLSDLSGGLLGICNFPTNVNPGSSAFNQDGCDVLADSLPGGSAVSFNLGGTTAHEVGHWFGLFHVFQGQSCSGSGDSVADTPIQKTATSGCPATKDSCPNSSGLDAVHNYMDYSSDECYTSFTQGQVARMFQMWDTYRAGK